MNNDIFWAAFEDELDKIASVKSTVKGVGLTAAALASLAGGAEGDDKSTSALTGISAKHVTNREDFGRGKKLSHRSIEEPSYDNVKVPGPTAIWKKWSERSSLEDKAKDIFRASSIGQRLKHRPLELRVRDFVRGRRDFDLPPKTRGGLLRNVQPKSNVSFRGGVKG